jgi:hypothetical protein
VTQHKYNPSDFKDMPDLNFEIADFYDLLEKYRNEKTGLNFTLLDKQRRDLLFSVKHRVVEGRLSEIAAQEMRDYFGGLFDEAQTDD